MYKIIIIFFSLFLSIPATVSGTESISEADKFVKAELEEINSNIKSILEKFMFDGNDSLTRRDITVEINKYLAKSKKITKYDVVCDDSNNQPDIVDQELVRVTVRLVSNNSNTPVTLKYEVGSSGVFNKKLDKVKENSSTASTNSERNTKVYSDYKQITQNENTSLYPAATSKRPQNSSTRPGESSVAGSTNVGKSIPSNQHADLIKQGCQMGRDDANSGKAMDSTAISLKNAGSKYIDLEAQIRNEYEKCYKESDSVSTKTTSEKFPNKIAKSSKNPGDSSSSVSNSPSQSSKTPEAVTEHQYRQAKSEISSIDNQLSRLDNKLSYLNRLEKELADWKSWPLIKGQINHTEAQRKQFIQRLERGLEAQEARLKGELEEKERLLKEKERNIQTVSLYLELQEQIKVAESNNEIERYIGMLNKKGIDLSETVLPTTLEKSENLLSELSARLNDIEEAELKKQQLAQEHVLLKNKILLLQDRLEKAGAEADRTEDVSTYSLAKMESDRLQNKIDALEDIERSQQLRSPSSANSQPASKLDDDSQYLEKSAFNSSDSLFVFIIIWIVIVVLGAVFGFGESRKIVVFRDYNDIAYVFLGIVVIGILAISLNGIFDNQILNTVFKNTSLIISVGAVLFFIKRTYDDNHSVVKTFVALVTKITLGIAFIANVVNLINPEGDSILARSKNRGKALLLLTILTPIIGSLVKEKTGLFSPDLIRGRSFGRY